jgi:serine/threonine protein kinase
MSAIDTTSASPLKIKVAAKQVKESAEPSSFTIRILCPSCEVKNEYCISTVFEKVSCHQCEQNFRVPAETPHFHLFNSTFETDYFEIFKAQSKTTQYEGAVVSYDKLHFHEQQNSSIRSTVKKYMDLPHVNYLIPEELIETDHCYSIFRSSPTLMMNIYLQKRGSVKVQKAASILSNIAFIASKLAEHDIYDSFIPSDVLLSKSTGQVFLGDYGLRGELVQIMDQHANLFIETLAPETASRRPHSEASAVYSLGIIAVLFLTGEFPFSEVDPQFISRERSKFLKNFDYENLPDFLPRLLSMEVHERPSLAECAELFSDLATTCDS